MKSKKGFADLVLVFVLCVGVMVLSNAGRTDAQKVQTKADVEKSFGQPKGNVLVFVDKLNEKPTVMNDFDRTSSSSQVNEGR